MSERLQSGPSVYDLLDTWAGERFTLEVAERLAYMPMEQLDHFEHHYRNWLPKLNVPPKRPGELRPHVPNMFHGVNNAGGLGVSLRDEVGIGTYNCFLFLYAHSVAMPSQLEPLFEMRRSWYSDPDNEWKLREPLFYTLMTYADLRPLAEQGALHWLEGPEFHLPMHLDPVDVGRLLEGVDVWSWDEIDLGPNRSWGNACIGATRALHELLPAISLVDRGLADLSLRHKFYRRILDLLVSNAELENRPNLTSPDSRLQRLIRLSVPNMRLPSIADMTSVRENEPTFISWRNSLTQALCEVDNLSDHNDIEYARAIMSEHLQPEIERLEKVIKGGSIKSSLATGVQAFGFAALGGAASTFTGGSLATSLVSSSTSGALTAICAHLRNRRERRQSCALLSHYMTFSSGA